MKQSLWQEHLTWYWGRGSWSNWTHNHLQWIYQGMSQGHSAKAHIRKLILQHRQETSESRDTRLRCRARSPSRSNACVFSFERVRLLVRTHASSCSNAPVFLLERARLPVRTRSPSRSNASLLLMNTNALPRLIWALYPTIIAQQTLWNNVCLTISLKYVRIQTLPVPNAHQFKGNKFGFN